MFKWIIATLLWLVLASPAAAQNTTCATRPAGDSSNACASTAFVNGGSSPAIGKFTPNLPIIGGPTGYFAQGTRSGNTTLFPTIDGTPVSGQCPVYDSFGGFLSTPCTPSGSGNVSAGTIGQLAIYTGTTTVAGTTTGAGVITAIGNAIGAASGLAALDSNTRLNNFETNSDWLATYAYGQSAAMVGLGAVNDGGITGAARTSQNTTGGGGIAMLGGAFWGFADGGSFPANPVWGLYAECRAFSTSTSGYCAGSEIEITNFKGGTQPVVTDPYNSEATGATFGLHVASGGGCTVASPCYNPITGLTNLTTPLVASSALTISSNSGSVYGLFNNGIVFSCGSVGTTDCSGNGSGNAMAMYSGLNLTWFSPGNSQIFQIAASGTRTGGSVAWGPSGLNFGGLVTSGAGGGLYLCIDSAGTVYKKASCP